MIAMCGSAIRSAFLWNGRPKSPWEPLYRFTPSVRKTGMSKAWRSSRHRPPDEQTFLSDAAAGRGSILQATTLLRGRRLSLSSFASVLASLTVRLKPESRHDGTAFWPASAPEGRARLSGACGSTSCRSASGPSRGRSESTPSLLHPLSSSARQGPFDSGSSGRTGYNKVVSCAWERHSQCLARALLRYDTSCMRDCMLTAKRQHIRRIFV